MENRKFKIGEEAYIMHDNGDIENIIISHASYFIKDNTRYYAVPCATGFAFVPQRKLLSIDEYSAN